MKVVCVPDAGFGEGLRAAVPGIEVIVWDGHRVAPDGVGRAQFVVPPYPSTPWSDHQLARLRAITVCQVLSAGYEPWLPLLPAQVTLCNGRGIHGASTAELAITGLLMHWHHLPALAENQRRHGWQPVQGETVMGKRVLVLGAGDIGMHTATVLRALGAEVTLAGRRPRPGVAPVTELPQLCGAHDALVIAVPLSEQTRGLVDGGLLARLPDGAVVVNVARGPVVDTAALLRELSSGRLRAVLDVTDPEPLPPDHPLWDAPGLIITPHVGGGTVGWRDRAQRLINDQVLRFVTGDPLQNVVRPGRTAPSGLGQP